MAGPLTMQGIVDLASAYYGSATLFAALEVDVFGRIQARGGQANVTALAADAGADERGMRLLLDACVAVGLLTKDGALYANTEASAACLVAGSPRDLSRAIRYNRDVYPVWGRLPELVKTGRPAEAPEVHLGADPARTRAFVMAMHGRAMGIGRAVVPMLDLAGCRDVLDLAGGPGTYAVLIAQANPGVRCVTRDLPAVASIAAELVRAAGMQDRVTCLPGDYHSDTYPAASADAVTIFGALHQESPEAIVSILRRAQVALRPGGRIFILDMMTDATHTQPAFSALFAVNMALTTRSGWVFSDEELKGWLVEAGFEACRTQVVPPPMPHWLVSARKHGMTP